MTALATVTPLKTRRIIDAYDVEVQVMTLTILARAKQFTCQDAGPGFSIVNHAYTRINDELTMYLTGK